MFTHAKWRNNITEILEVVWLVFVAYCYLCNGALLNVVWSLEMFVLTKKNVWIVSFNYFINISDLEMSLLWHLLLSIVLVSKHKI